MTTANEFLADSAIKHAIGLQRYTSGELQRMMALLNRVDADIAAIMQKYDPTDVAPRYAEQRLEKMLVAIRELNAEVYDAFVKALSGDMRDLAAYEAAFQAKLIEQAIPVEFDVVKPPPAQVRAAALARPFQGRLLKEWGKDLEASAFAKVRDSIRIGFVEGETIDQLVRRIRGTRKENYKDGILEINRRNAEAVVRTAVAHTAQSARDDVFAANADIVKGWKFTATLDARTSAVCRGLDGKVFDLGKGPKPPRHFNCRSVSTPVLKSWREMGIDIEETPNPKNIRASLNGQVPASETYDSWLRKQPIEFQNEVLGVKKARLFRAGLTLDKFVSRNGSELSLEELARKEADIFKRAGV
jgi:SPP1 gp7 family putative phage head morphogenesis protein